MAKTALAGKNVDQVLKAILVFARTVEYVLETRAVASAASGGLSASKVQILRLLGQRGGQTSTRVARFLGVTKPAVTQLIDSMIRDKLVTRKTGKLDRREVNLQLTPKGRAGFQAIRRAQRHYVRNALRNVSGRDVDRWVATMNRISSALGRADKAFEQFCAQCGAHESNSCVLVGGDATCLFLHPRLRRSQMSNDE